MNTVMSNFRVRVHEVNEYFEFLERVLQSNAILEYTEHAGTVRRVFVAQDVQKILKANSFLILYNLIESTIKQTVIEICSSILTDALTFRELRGELQQLWISSRHGNLSASKKTLDCIRQIVEDVMNDISVELDAELVSISGNIDARKVRELAAVYGFSHVTRREARGGEKLLSVKTQRNNLAHGAASFIECGRDQTYEDLRDTREQVVSYLEDILGNVKTYLDNKEYASAAYRQTHASAG
jgi:hypothetical protein